MNLSQLKSSLILWNQSRRRKKNSRDRGFDLKPKSRKFGFDRGTPIDRYYIEKFLKAENGHIKGRLLEVANSHYSQLFGGPNVESYEILNSTPDKAATIIGDLTDLSTLPEGQIDCFICTQTFNFIFDVKNAIEGACHLLKANGILLATVGGISPISRYDMDRWGDYWRFTSLSIKRLFEEVFKPENIEIKTYGNVLSSSSFLYGLAAEELEEEELDHHDPDYELLITIKATKTG